MNQLSFFERQEIPLVRIQPPILVGANLEALKRYAFLYTVNQTGKHSGIRFMMTVEDAQAWCESPISKGVMMGPEWMYCWTAVSIYIGAYRREETIDLTEEHDNGAWDERIALLGLTKIGLDEIGDVLAPFGVKVERKRRFK